MDSTYRDLFSYPNEMIYVNNASVGMNPTKSINKMKSLLDTLAVTGAPSIDDIIGTYSQFRENAGKMLNAPPEGIAFVSNTTEGLTIALQSIALNAGENIIVHADSFPASQYILEYVFPHIEKRRITVGDGTNLIEKIEKNIDSKTRAVILDYVNFLTGYRIDLKQISALCRDKQIFSIIDGIQGMGACEIDVLDTDIDFFSVGGQKWLLSPMGSGIFYVRPSLLPELKPFHVGWLSAQHENFDSFYPLRPLAPTAQRFEYANAGFIGLTGMVESLKMFNSIGITEIQKLIFNTTDLLIQELRSRGAEVLAHSGLKHRSGIVSFRHPTIDTKLIFNKFQTEHIICSQREGFIRIAVHFYNSEKDIQRIIQVIDQI